MHLILLCRDLKPENILLDISGYAVLTDFGFAKMIPKGSKSFTMCGTPEYLAPEMILQTGHSHAVDWWSLGILIFEMVAGKPPFCDEDRVTMFKSITNISYRMPSHFSTKEFVSTSNKNQCICITGIAKSHLELVSEDAK